MKCRILMRNATLTELHRRKAHCECAVAGARLFGLQAGSSSLSENSEPRPPSNSELRRNLRLVYEDD